MTNTEKETKIREALSSQDLFELKSVMDVNHKPHPYTIGPQHVVYAADHHSGMLDMDTIQAVPCAVSGCNIPYEEHTSDNVCFLKLKRNGTNDESGDILKSLTDILGEKFIDGFAFVETKDKFRIS